MVTISRSGDRDDNIIHENDDDELVVSSFWKVAGRAGVCLMTMVIMGRPCQCPFEHFVVVLSC